MFKLVVLFAIVAVAVAKPGYLHGYPAVAYSPAVAVPAAVSHTYRADYISKPVIATYAVPAVHTVPVVQKTFVAAPVAYAHAPLLAYSGHPW